DILPYLDVQRTQDPQDPASQLAVMEELTGMTLPEAEKLLKEQGLTAVPKGEGETVSAQIPAAGTSVPGGSEVLLYMGQTPQEQPVTVPDFVGMQRQQASDAAGSAGLYIHVSGNTDISPTVKVTAQSVPAGTRVEPGTTIQLEFADLQYAD
ncbi:MAG: PASTA domain-containing protein, partial [Oscillospiraceae bacterium]|nr:PASTA domain-containing protein [Oscillospiraceae bacterium]